MKVGIMITNGGTHPPEKWAEQVVGQIIQIPSAITGAAAEVGRKIELKMLDVMEEAFREVQKVEKTTLEEVGIGHLKTGLDGKAMHDRIVPFVEPTLVKLIDTAKGTMHEAHFAAPHVQDYIRRTITQHFGNAMHIERLTAADSQPGSPDAQAYKAKYQQGAAPV